MASLQSSQGNSKELNLSNQNLQNMVQVSENMKILDLSHNKIALIEGLSEKNTLTEVNLSYNRLISIEGIASLGCLRVLNISYNFLSPSQLGHLKKLKRLKVLNASHNHFSGDEALAYINDLHQVKELDLSFNDFLTWNPSTPMGSLVRLILDNNKLKRINLQNLPNLQVLSCIENSISEIFGLASLTGLTQLFVDSNELSELPPLPSVQTISASHNKLSFLPVFPSLQLLNASFNLLNQLNKVSGQIRQLIVASNCLTSLPSGMKHLEVLEASNNKLSSLDFLSSSPNLSILKVAFNEFPSLDQVIWKVVHCPLVDADFSGVASSDSLYQKILRRFPYLEVFNDREVTEEDRMMVTSKESSSSEEKFQEILENFRPSSNLDLPDLPQGVSLKIDPNSSTELVKAKSSLSEYNSPRSVCLTPSHTETLSVIPAASSPRQVVSSDKSYVSYKMKEMYRSIVSSMKKNISKQFLDFAQEHDIPSQPRRHHHCRHHVCRKRKTSTDRNQRNLDTDEISRISKKSAASHLNHVAFNERTENWQQDKAKETLEDKEDEFRVSFSPIPTVQRNKIEEYFIKGVLKYCKTPPRPVLKHEKTKTLMLELSEGCQEFLIITSFFAQFSVKVLKVLKCFMFDAVCNKLFNWVGFFYASQDELVQIAKDLTCFIGSRVRLNENVKVNGSCCILCAGFSEQLTRVGPGFVETSENGLVVPSYVVWFKDNIIL